LDEKEMGEGWGGGMDPEDYSLKKDLNIYMFIIIKIIA